MSRANPLHLFPILARRDRTAFRQGIGEAFSKIQFGGMAAGFPEVAIGLPYNASLRFADRLN